jgi:hypothetical protein
VFGTYPAAGDQTSFVDLNAKPKVSFEGLHLELGCFDKWLEWAACSVG